MLVPSTVLAFLGRTWFKLNTTKVDRIHFFLSRVLEEDENGVLAARTPTRTTQVFLSDSASTPFRKAMMMM